MTDLAGSLIDNKYRLVRLLGEGGMGSVWSAEHTLINRTVAVKVMHAGPDKSEDHYQRFFREAQSASSIGHPNIIEIYDLGVEENGNAYMVMELLKGESLESLLIESGCLPPPRVVSITLQILSALLAAHRKGIVHRDIKPDNVFIAVNPRLQEEIKLLDFGVAKVLGSDKKTLKLTMEGTLLGTPYYFAPEQARGSKDLDARIDIWAVGVMMYEMLSGTLPYVGENYNEVIGQVLEGTARPLEEVAPDVPESLVEIVATAMQKLPEDRYRDVGKMMKALFPLQDNLGSYPAMKKSNRTSYQAAKNTLNNPESDKTGASRNSSTVEIDTAAGSLSKGPDKFRRSRVVQGVAALVLVFVIGILIIFVDKGQADEEPAPPSNETDPIGVKIEETQEPDTSKIDPKEDVGPSDSEPPTLPVPDVVENVTIRFVSLPPRSKITIDGKRVLTPHDMPRSDSPVELKVTAPGHNPYIKVLIPNEDRTIRIRMRKIEGKKPGKKSDGWKPNPFG
jgi:serine/threonine protein kinase